MGWVVAVTTAFRRDYKRLSSEVRKRVEQAVQELEGCEDPRRLAHQLRGRWEGLYSHEIGLQYRMVFRVDSESRVIELLAVGTHKVYR